MMLAMLLIGATQIHAFNDNGYVYAGVRLGIGIGFAQQDLQFDQEQVTVKKNAIPTFSGGFTFGFQFFISDNMFEPISIGVRLNGHFSLFNKIKNEIDNGESLEVRWQEYTLDLMAHIDFTLGSLGIGVGALFNTAPQMQHYQQGVLTSYRGKGSIQPIITWEVTVLPIINLIIRGYINPMAWHLPRDQMASKFQISFLIGLNSINPIFGA